MGCNNCKKNKTLKKEIMDTTKTFDGGVVIFFIIWTLLALYGLYELINKVI